MRTVVIIAVIVIGFLISFLVVSMEYAQGNDDPPTGEDLYQMITVIDPYEQWGQYPEATGTFNSSAPHGPLGRVYINSQVEGTIGNFTGMLPNNSIIVKENFDTETTPSEKILNVMWKVSGFDTMNNDWFWAAFNPDGSVMMEGAVSMCIDCHGANRENDFVFLHQFESSAHGNNYVGFFAAEQCKTCHTEAYDNWLAHGHARKLILGPKFNAYLPEGYGDARGIGIPLPDHYEWSDVLMVIGGSKYWKSRYVGLDGYILTEGGNNQYNWRTGTWSDYHKDEVKAYSCGRCHTTGYDENGSMGLPGIEGSFTDFNVSCEACHGPGADHVASPSTSNIVVDNSSELCGKCHTRGDDPDVIIAKDGYIRHHEQWPEFRRSTHFAIGYDCNTCHNPHVTRKAGIVNGCTKCHVEEEEEYSGSTMEKAGVTCESCHMPYIGKSAEAAGPYEGDVKTHLFNIDSSPDYEQFTADGTASNGSVSIEFACLRCHAGWSKDAVAELADSGEEYHTLGKIE